MTVEHEAIEVVEDNGRERKGRIERAGDWLGKRIVKYYEGRALLDGEGRISRGVGLTAVGIVAMGLAVLGTYAQEVSKDSLDRWGRDAGMVTAVNEWKMEFGQDLTAAGLGLGLPLGLMGVANVTTGAILKRQEQGEAMVIEFPVHEVA